MLRRTCLALVLAAAPAAQAQPCTPAIHDAELPAAWQQAVDVLKTELAMRTDIERCVDIAVRVDPDLRHASVVVTLGEHRAVRAVADPADLRSTVLALLIEPAQAPPDVAAKSAVIDGSGGGHGPARDLASPAPAEPAPLHPPSRNWVVEPVEHDLAARVIEHDHAAPPIAVDVGVAIGVVWTDRGAHPSVAAALRESRGKWSADVFGRLATSSGSGSMGASAAGGSAIAIRPRR